MEQTKGFVSFVGSGPGDPGLITQKGAASISKADIILYDRLANPRLLRYANETCEFIYCGKLPHKHILRQNEINDLLVKYAKQGKYVLRLKGGDPAVFGRVGEEAEALEGHQIPYEIIPGITASIAAASYAGIPVTHRNYSNSITFRTGHYCAKNEGSSTDGQHIGETIAYYMGVKNIAANCSLLISQGKPKDTKVAVIQWATLGKQRVVTGTLETIAAIVDKEKIESPAMMIAGDVVSLRDSLAWFEKKPFFGKRIIIAKSTAENNYLESYFTEQGAEAFSFPTFKQNKLKLEAEDLEEIMRAEQLVFTSPASVDFLMNQLMALGYDIRDLPRNIKCRSNKTVKRLASKGLIANQAIDHTQQTAVVGAKGFERQFPCNEHTAVFYSHSVEIDGRFEEINYRMLTEDEWETVIFPNKAAVDQYLVELKQLCIKNDSFTPAFAYIGESVKAYAQQQGFTVVDEVIQAELERKDWRRS